MISCGLLHFHLLSSSLGSVFRYASQDSWFNPNQQNYVKILKFK